MEALESEAGALGDASAAEGGSAGTGGSARPRWPGATLLLPDTRALCSHFRDLERLLASQRRSPSTSCFYLLIAPSGTRGILTLTINYNYLECALLGILYIHPYCTVYAYEVGQ